MMTNLVRLAGIWYREEMECLGYWACSAWYRRTAIRRIEDDEDREFLQAVLDKISRYPDKDTGGDLVAWYSDGLSIDGLPFYRSSPESVRSWEELYEMAGIPMPR